MDGILSHFKLESLSSAVTPVFADLSLVFVRLGTLIFAYVLAVCVYRLTIHPLAKYPGPFFAKLTDWDVFFKVASGNRHCYCLRDHERYGPIVRIGPNKLSINKISALNAIYINRDANVIKGDWYKLLVSDSGMFALNPEDKTLKATFGRRAIEHGFSDKSLRAVEESLVEDVHIWCTHLGEGASDAERWTPPKDAQEWSSYLTYDMMSDMTYGKRVDYMGSDENRHVPGLVMAASKFMYTIGHLPIINILWPLRNSRVMTFFAGDAVRGYQTNVEYAGNLLDDRIRREKKNPDCVRKDFMYYLMNARDPKSGKAYSLQELRDDSRGFVMAGSDTTAIVIAASIFYFLQKPDILNKVLEEVRGNFSSVGEITGVRSMKNLVFLRACVEETLRMSPPVTAPLPRKVQPGGMMFEGNYLPAGTEVGTGAYAMHHNEEYYPDSFSYIPERWIVDPKATSGIQTKESVDTAREAFCAFSYGVRGCVGKNLAYLEIMLALSILLYQFDIRLPEDSAQREPCGGGSPTHHHWGRRRKGEYQLVDLFTADREGPMIEFRARND